MADSAQYISQLNTDLPRGTDWVRDGDDEIRNFKGAVLRTLPNFDRTINITAAQINAIASGFTIGSAPLTTAFSNVDTCPSTSNGVRYHLICTSGTLYQSLDVRAIKTGEFSTFSTIGSDLLDVDISASGGSIVLRVRIKSGSGTLTFDRVCK